VTNLHSIQAKTSSTAIFSSQMYGDLERFFYSDKIQFRAIIPLLNFTGYLAEIHLGQGLKIRRITTSEIEQLLDLRFSPLRHSEIIHVKYVAEFGHSLKKIDWRNHWIVRQSVAGNVGQVGYGFAYSSPASSGTTHL